MSESDPEPVDPSSNDVVMDWLNYLDSSASGLDYTLEQFFGTNVSVLTEQIPLMETLLFDEQINTTIIQETAVNFVKISDIEYVISSDPRARSYEIRCHINNSSIFDVYAEVSIYSLPNKYIKSYVQNSMLTSVMSEDSGTIDLKRISNIFNDIYKFPVKLIHKKLEKIVASDDSTGATDPKLVNFYIRERPGRTVVNFPDMKGIKSSMLLTVVRCFRPKSTIDTLLSLVTVSEQLTTYNKELVRQGLYKGFSFKSFAIGGATPEIQYYNNTNELNVI